MRSSKTVSSLLIQGELQSGARDLWENSLFFDFTLEVEDESIPVHKVVLAACSGYFRAMFNSSMKESKENSVTLKCLSSNRVKSIISFIYTGDLELARDTVEDVLCTAQYLQISSAVVLCTDYMLEDLHWDTVFEVQHLAQKYSLDDVEKAVDAFIMKSFEGITEDAVQSIGSHILKLVDSDALCIKSEYSLFEKLLMFRSVLTEDELCEALWKVRFPLMSTDELEKISNTELMTQPRFNSLLDEARVYHQDVTKQAMLQTERTRVRSNKLTMVVGTVVSIHGICESEARFIRKSTNRDILQIESLDNFLYVIETVNHSCIGLFRYDPRFCSWQELEPLLHDHRYGFPFVVYKQQLFANGGCDLKTVEVYDIPTNKWRYCADINYENDTSAGVLVGNRIYVCGGHNYVCSDSESDEYSEEIYLKTLSCYDPEKDTWQFKAPMLEGRYMHQIAALDGKVYVFGGIGKGVGVHSTELYIPAMGDGVVLHSVECYSPETNQWTAMRRRLSQKIEGLWSNGSSVFLLTLTKDQLPHSVQVYSEEYDPNDKLSTKRFVCNAPYSDEGYQDGIPMYWCASLYFPHKD